MDLPSLLSDLIPPLLIQLAKFGGDLYLHHRRSQSRAPRTRSARASTRNSRRTDGALERWGEARDRSVSMEIGATPVDGQARGAACSSGRSRDLYDTRTDRVERDRRGAPSPPARDDCPDPAHASDLGPIA